MIQSSINFSLTMAKHAFLPSFKALLVLLVLSTAIISTAFSQFHNGIIGQSELFDQIGWVALLFFGAIMKSIQFAKNNGQSWY